MTELYSPGFAPPHIQLLESRDCRKYRPLNMWEEKIVLPTMLWQGMAHLYNRNLIAIDCGQICVAG